MRSVVGPAPDRGVVRHRHGEALFEIFLAVLAALAYFGVRNLAAGSAATAYANADRLMRLEEAMHLDWERRLQAPIVASDALTDLANWVYIWGHWPVIISVAIVLFRCRRDRYLLLRNAMLISGGIGFLFFALFPVAPPRLADPALSDTVTLHSEAYRALQPPGLTDQYAAFPSLHFGWNLLVAFAVWGATRQVAVRTLAVIGPAAMAAAVVLTANHYLVDVIAGLAVVLVGLLAHRLISSRSLRHSNRSPLPSGQVLISRDARRHPYFPTPRIGAPSDAVGAVVRQSSAVGKEVCDATDALDSVPGAGGLPAPDPAFLRGHRLSAGDAAGGRRLRAQRRVRLRARDSGLR
jgi:membrane-associated phospholipid phosphatase